MDYRIDRSSPTSTTGLRRVRTRLEQTGFWGSVLLPLAYLPVLYGTSGETRVLSLTGILTIHVICLVLGHDYSR